MAKLNARYNRWLLNKEKQRGEEKYTIKRWVYFEDGSKKLERLPIAKYKLFRNDFLELQKL
jgi:hypothetical protein